LKHFRPEYFMAAFRINIGLLILVSLTGSTLAAEGLRFADLHPEHRIQRGKYSAAATYTGSHSQDHILIIRAVEKGKFRAPRFLRVGGSIAEPEVLENEGGLLRIKLKANHGPFPKYPVGSTDKQVVREEVRQLLRGSDVDTSHKSFKLDSDRERRAFLIRLSVLSLCTDEGLPGKAKSEKMLRENLFQRLQKLGPKISSRSLSRLSARELGDKLNFLIVNRRLEATGVPAQFQEEALVLAILRQQRPKKLSPAALYSTAKVESLPVEELGVMLEYFGLEKRHTRSSTKKKRDAVYEAVAWRALVRRNRIQHLDRKKVEEFVQTNQAAAIQAAAEQIRKQQPGNENPEQAALTQLTDDFFRRQYSMAAVGIPLQDRERFYHPFRSGKALGEAYGFLNKSDSKQLYETLKRFGVSETALKALKVQTAAKLYEASLATIAAASPDRISRDTVQTLSPFFEGANSAAGVWKAFRTYDVELRYDYDEPGGTDRNAYWKNAENFSALVEGEKIGTVTLTGSMSPDKGDTIDWWHVPASLKDRPWQVVPEDAAIGVDTVPADKGSYLKVRSRGPATKYTLESKGEGERAIKRFERVEAHKEVAGPPF
jgi:hypothetical protein